MEKKGIMLGLPHETFSNVDEGRSSWKTYSLYLCSIIGVQKLAKSQNVAISVFLRELILILMALVNP